MFGGEYKHAVDAKNRLFMPAKFREQLGDTFILVKGTDKCISVYSPEAWAEFDEKMNALPDFKVRNVKRIVYASLTEVQPDGQGRVLIPTPLREYAHLSKNAAIIGVGSHVEIWDEASWMLFSTGDSSCDLTAEMAALGL